MNRVVNLRPMVSLASRFVGAGPNRLKMVRLWHELDPHPLKATVPLPASISA
jgi:hypothetical protein